MLNASSINVMTKIKNFAVSLHKLTRVLIWNMENPKKLFGTC